jgi:hypothetical protein
MTSPLRTLLQRLLAIAGAFGMFLLALVVLSFTSPVVYLHYAASATVPVTYFFNEDNDIVKDRIAPGARLEFRTSHRRRDDYFINISLPDASRDGVDITPPFSRVDVYIGADTRIARTVVRTDFLARLGID